MTVFSGLVAQSAALAGESPNSIGASVRASSGHYRGWLLAQNYDVIRTKDGKVRVGSIMRETQQGFLFKNADGTTEMIEYGKVDQIQSGAPQQQQQQQDLRAPPPPPPVEAPYQAPSSGMPSMAPAPQVPYQNAYRHVQLETELRELQEENHGLGGPIALLASGAGVIIVGAVVSALAASAAASSINYNNPYSYSGYAGGALAATIIAWVGYIAGGALHVTGGILLVRKLIVRGRTNQRIEEIQAELRAAPGAPRNAEVQRPPPAHLLPANYYN